MTRSRTEWRLDLPFKSPPLRDNDRKHWAVKAKKVRELREQAALLAASQRLPRGLEHVVVVLHWQPGTNRRRDALSAAPTLKPLVDGLVDYGLVVDDDTSHVDPRCRVYGYERGVPAACWLTIDTRPE